MERGRSDIWTGSVRQSEEGVSKTQWEMLRRVWGEKRKDEGKDKYGSLVQRRGGRR